MYPKPRNDISPNTAEFEQHPVVSPYGFREYDVRWLYPEEINLLGIHILGASLAGKIRDQAGDARVVVAHDYRSYSAAIKYALTSGLMAGGAQVFDIGLGVTPMAYFAQFELEVSGVAMVTASHNENGWTGVKMGAQPPLTFGPEIISSMKDEVLSGAVKSRDGGRYSFVPGIAGKYMDDLVSHGPFRRKMKAVVACGNGTAGAFAPEVLSRLGIDVVPLQTRLDHTFPNHNPNPEDLAMLAAVTEAVRASGADVGLAFDGDGDRCGFVDETGREIFADKIGVLLARDISSRHDSASFVVDVKSTGLYHTDPVLKANKATTEYWKTGHSHIKRRSFETGALAGFEKSGHFFINPPFGRGYDDGLVAAIAVLDMLDHNPDQTMAGLFDGLPKTWGSPTMSPHCADETKYEVAERAVAHFGGIAKSGGTLAGQKVTGAITVNGIRIVLEDGTWGLVRASSNKPELVVVVESPTSDANMRAIFGEIDKFLSAQPEVGAYNQKI